MLYQSLLITVLATSTLAAPSLPPHSTKNGGISSVSAYQNPNFVRNGPRALTKALNKFGLTRHVPTELRKRQNTEQVGTEPAFSITEDGEDDIEYLSPVNIGGQVMNLQFDTGSSDLWVYSSLLPANESSGHGKLYHPSKTFQKIKNATWGIQYADLSYANGDVVGTDVVTVGGVSFGKQVVELATNISSAFMEDPYSQGLLGLAFSYINTVKPVSAKTFSQNVQHSLAKGLFTADLKHEVEGTFDFGFIDKAKYTGAIKYTDLKTFSGPTVRHPDWIGKNIFWEFEAPWYSLGKHRVSTSKNNAVTAIADTGTTLLLVTDDIATAYYKTVKGAKFDAKNAGGYVFPCKAALPSITLPVGKTHGASIGGELLNFGFWEPTNSSCFGALQGSGDNMMIYGDVFFKKYFSIFDLDKTRFGFAAKPTNATKPAGYYM